MYHKMGEMMRLGETNMDERGGAWRRENDGDEWQRWNGSWLIRVEQTDLNSRQRRKISRGLRRMITLEQHGTAGLLRELRNGIKVEIEGSNRRHLSTLSQIISGTHERIQLVLQ